ncbi:S24/S26 family peptidase [uncultured Erythrobacter sp.]|uniref:S24/S26 family peptidase n=1 Tax=uncultured Erythrobacter sp. TaxID=263913 RepID=UPI002631DBF8|nr:S24/S26 family peptidase [uncultured Erythrobacter sp.]
MFGFSIARVRGKGIELNLPEGSIALFRRRKTKAIRRGDVVLVDHPDLGRIVKKVTAVGRKGNVHLKGMSSSATGDEPSGKVPREAVLGRFVRRLI